ncbi:MAG: acetyltransferase [Marinobacter sp.]|nr:acetyltransferase [Marinobacter sp.]
MTGGEGEAVPVIVLGAGGHARVLIDLLTECGVPILGVCDPGLASSQTDKWQGLSVLGADDILEEFDVDDVVLANGVGFLPRSLNRQNLFCAMKARGFRFPEWVHPSAFVSRSTELHSGAQVMAGAIVQAGSVIHENAIINTGASIDHESAVGSHVHVAPGATICGNVTIGEGAFIGAGATVTQGVSIGARSVIGAGVTLRHDAEPDSTYRLASTHYQSNIRRRGLE